MLLQRPRGHDLQTKRIRFAEANWSREFTRPWLTTILWLFLSMPALLLLLAFDIRDRHLAAADQRANEGVRGLIREVVRDGVDQAAQNLRGRLTPNDATTVRLAWRLLVAFTLFNGAVGLLAWLPTSASLFIGAILLLLLLSPRTNLANHVVVAMEDKDAYKQITAKVERCLTTAAQYSAKVTVVGHSQGGLIAHDVVKASTRPANVGTLIGLGSGLKPITLLRALRRPRVLAASWLGTVVSGAFTAAIVMHVDLSSDLFALQALRWGINGLVALSLSPMGALDHFWRSPALTPDAFAPWEGISFTWSSWLLVVGVLYAVSLWWLRRLMREEDLDLDLDSVARVDWTEITSPHDAVGRLLLPKLPQQVTQIPVTLGGNPILDHTTYFAKTSPVPLYILEDAACSAHILNRRTETVAVGVMEDLCVLGARRRRVAHLLALGVISAGIIFTMVAGHSLRQASMDVIRSSGTFIATVALFLHVSETNAQRAAFQTPLALFEAQARARRARRQLERVTPWAWIPLLEAAFVLWTVGLSITIVYGRNSPMSPFTLIGAWIVLCSGISYFGGYKIKAMWIVPAGLLWFAFLTLLYVGLLANEGLPAGLVLFMPGYGVTLSATFLAIIGWGIAMWSARRPPFR